MKVTKIRIGGRMFILDPQQDLDQLRAEITAAATSGANFVYFTTAGGVAVSALVTPYLPVRISVIDSETATPAEQVAQSIDDPPFATGTQFDV